MSDPGSSGSGGAYQVSSVLTGDSNDAEKLAILQQQMGESLKQKQMDLMSHFERAKQALTIQHIQQYYQELANLQQNQQAAAEQREEEPSSNGLSVSLSMSNLLGKSHPPVASTSKESNLLPSVGHAQPVKLKSGFREMRSLSSSSGSQTISQHTKDRLKNMIAQRREGSQTNLSGTPPTTAIPPVSPQVNVSSPHFEPYRVPATLQQSPQQTFHPADFQLRKVNSEPNLKMRIRAKLLSKGSSPVQNQSAFQFPQQSGIRRSDSETSNTMPPDGLLGAGSLVPNLIMPSPSLPNLNVTSVGSPAQLPFDLSSLMAAAQLSPFLSLPSLLKAQLGLGLNDDAQDGLDRARLDPRNTLGLSQSIPVGGYPSLLKQQLRELVLRRKSLVREEPEDDEGHSSTILDAARVASLLTTAEGAGCRIFGGTGIAYDSAMARHECVCGESSSHVEHGGRVQSIWARIAETGLINKCEKVTVKKASLEQLRLVHSSTYVTFFAISPTACLKMEASELPVKSFVQLPCGGIGIDSDTYFNDNSTQLAARVATGSLIELASQVAEGKLRNGFACIRPPGHHAERDQAMGFCFFNNIAICARQLQLKYPQQCTRIAIIDWDVHHGNGTQLCFEEDPSVLYLSLHRHDNGNFFPGTGAVTDVGRGPGKGFSLNVPFSGDVMRDPEYLAAWRVVVEPVLEDFQPTFILVSAGFDAGCRHANALGGYEVSSAMFGYMTRQLMNYADGRVVLALEGGYDLTTIADAAEHCIRVLCGDDDDAGRLSCSALEAVPNISAQETIQKVVAIHKGYWPSLTGHQGISTSEMQWRHVEQQLKQLTMDTS